MCIYISIYIQSQLQADLSWERKSKKKKTRLADYNLRQIIRNRGHISYAHITFLFKKFAFWWHRPAKTWILQKSQRGEKITVNNAFSPNCQVSCDLILVMVDNGCSRQPETFLVKL